MIMKALKKMAEDDNVRVYYLRGNHDHEMDANCVAEMFGDMVSSILSYCMLFVSYIH